MSAGELPRIVAIVDVSAQCYRLAKIVWQAGGEVGVNFSSTDFEISPAEMSALLAADRRPKTGKAAPKSPAERRRWARKRVRLRPVVLATIDRRFLTDGQMIDASDGGARLRCINPERIPKTIILFDIAEQVARRAEVVWTGRAEIGVNYVGAAYSEDPAGLKSKGRTIG
ncbi:hypothetical protein LQ948_06785 [Jiella sp. MQZ9-1]|uniref:PilZ domain-containing protein n=1 Tax=Jiella flava TaxID=2816857 RepID=A0A939FXZ2_9HYPH|nr:hypothetical protein [Jiella flava]MBO0662261.1 hypothetical protein [Jiella flava]MCD2470908.1 hypothetical protein [Jiella flava]